MAGDMQPEQDDLSSSKSRERFFHSILDAVRTGLVLIDPKTHIILYVNPVAAALIGESRDRIVGSVCHQYICPAEKGKCPITDQGQTVDHSERILITRDGRQIPIIKTVGYITVDQEDYLLEHITDASELKKTAAKARENDRKVRAIFDQTFQFMGIMTPDGILVEANRSAVKFSGVEEKDVIGKPFWETPWWTHSKELQQQLRDAVHRAAQGEFVRFEATHKAPDGSLHTIDFSLKPVKDEKGHVDYLIPEGRDITRWKEAADELRRKNDELSAAYAQLTATEEELRANYDELALKEAKLAAGETKIRAIFDQTFGFIGILTPDGVLTDANQSGLAFTGLKKDEIIGKKVWDIWGVREFSDLEMQFKESVMKAAQGEFIRFEVKFQAPQNTFQFVDFSIKPVMTGDRTVLYLIIEGRDITDRKMAEDALRQKNEDLYAAYEQLTATEEELRQNYDEIAASNQEKEVLLREIHHRVKNNLQIIISLLNLQCKNITDKKILGAIQESQNRIRAMVLVHEKIYQSTHIAEIEMMDYIHFLVRYLFEFYKNESAGITFIQEGEKIKVSLSTAVPLSLIINEIVSNTLKHAFAKGTPGTIHVITGEDTESMVITIRDNGCGIPDTIDPSTCNTLGLTLIENLAAQIRADLTLDRTNGTSYTIRIPRRPPD